MSEVLHRRGNFGRFSEAFQENSQDFQFVLEALHGAFAGMPEGLRNGTGNFREFLETSFRGIFWGGFKSISGVPKEFQGIFENISETFRGFSTGFKDVT